MKITSLNAQQIQALKARYQALASQLGSFPSLSQGSVVPQPPHAWMWTRKVCGKTVTRSLSSQKAQQMKQAIDNYRALEKLIKEMREITQNLILHAPETPQKNIPKNHPKYPLT